MRMSLLHSLLCVFCFVQLSVRAAAPVIAHEAPTAVTAGQPLRLVARVSSSQPLEHVTLHLAGSSGAEPLQLPMSSAGAGVYVVTVEAKSFSSLSQFRYYIDARAKNGEWTETNWATVRVIGGSAEASTGGEWKRPVLIGAGAAVAVGAGVALAGSGGGGGGDGGGGDDGGDSADDIIVRSATDSVDSLTQSFPVVAVVSADDELNGRTVERVRIRLEFDGVDAGPEEYSVTYNGATVISGAAGGFETEQVDVVGADSTQVLIQVLSSVAVGGTFTYRYNATITYFLAP